MAAKASIDPLAFRLKYCSDPKYRGVLTVVATMAEVEVDWSSGRVKVKRVVCAQDMGLVVNPAGATIQMEGCIMMGLGYALTEEQRFRGGEILELNFDSYELPRFSALPRIDDRLRRSRAPWRR
jgi:CO/xanthine dehydrogenase Mo-binding subunit